MGKGHKLAKKKKKKQKRKPNKQAYENMLKLIIREI